MSLESSTISIQGIDELIAKFDGLPAKIEKKILKDAVNKMGSEMLAELKARCFVAAEHRKKGSIRHTKKISSRRGGGGGAAYNLYFPDDLKDSIEISSAQVSKGRLVANIRSNFYAKFLEFGSYGHPGYHPFVRPAMDSSADPIMQDALNFLLGAIQLL